ncbi:MAG: carboxyl-terminal protease [Flavobacteriaceae bacterium]|nr:carboxyl-terminal protease [Bacteroidia bacterium]NNL16964.1 carboxyl-terminal protease [Flavobacteriaceae bacterium]
MQLFKRFLLLVLISSLLQGCFTDIDDDFTSNTNIKSFIWRGMNLYYLYKDNVPDLADDRFTNSVELQDYLEGFSSPESLFNNLLYDPVNVDEFSFLVNDYLALEQFLSGTSVSNGMDFDIKRVPGSGTDLFGIVRYVLPNTSAEEQGIERGDVFYSLNGTQLTVNNYLDIYNLNTYTIGLGTYDNNGTPETTDDDTIFIGEEIVTLSKSAYTEDPIHKTEIINVDGNNVGYLMYNFFNRNFDGQLNDVFGEFAGSNITDLVLDLRYNPGGFVSSAINLSSMITGQFYDDIFATQQWNSTWQTFYEENDPEYLIDRFQNELSNGTSINSLNLNKVYILTTGASASASELVINSLTPYIDVVQIGTNTRGKYQASNTYYDSPDFRRENANPNHTYAIQPLIFKTLNRDGVTDYDDGLIADVLLSEDLGNLGVLGDVNEPLLAEAIAQIQGTSRMSGPAPVSELKSVGDRNKFSPYKNRMFAD